MRAYPSESDLLQGADKTMYLPLFQRSSRSASRLWWFIKLSFTCLGSLQEVRWPFPVALLKKILFMTLVGKSKEDFTPIGTISIDVGPLPRGFTVWETDWIPPWIQHEQGGIHSQGAGGGVNGYKLLRGTPRSSEGFCKTDLTRFLLEAGQGDQTSTGG